MFQNPALLSRASMLCATFAAILTACGGGTNPTNSTGSIISTLADGGPTVNPLSRIKDRNWKGERAVDALTVAPTPDPGLPPAPFPTAPAPAAPAPTDAAPLGAGPCGVTDVGNWTIPVPSTRDSNVALRSLQQPGSRLFYISAATGSDSTGEMYFWDGTKLIDSAGRGADANGVAYGSDPMNPSVAVKPFRRWAYVGPRNDGSDIGSRGGVGGALVSTRGGYPDWWLFKRGETFDLSQDLLSFARETNAAIASVSASLAVPGGRSATERQIVGAYGDLCTARPRFVHPQGGFVTRWENLTYSPIFKNVAYLSLHFDGHDRTAGNDFVGLNLLYQSALAQNILFEDIWFDAARVNIGAVNGAQVTLRRSLITDNYTTDGSYVQGLFYDGSRSGRLRIEESILMRNGFSHGDPKTTPWPPSGTQVWAMNGRNLYVHGQMSNMNSTFVDSVSMLGASGDQFRAGLRVERNFFYQGYVSLGAYGGYPDSDGPTGSLMDNVLQRFVATGTNDNYGHPGWGIGLSSGAYAVEVARNIVTGAQYAGTGSAFGISPLAWVCYAHVFHYATRSNLIHDNIFESPLDSAAFGVSDGITGESTPGCSNWQYAGVKSNVVSNNVLITPSGQASSYDPIGAAVGTTNDTAYSGNGLYASRTAAASARGWPDPNRTLKTHLQANGVTVTSNDGFPEYFNLATQLRRGQWRPEWTATSILNHIRGGFGLLALP